jgi:hypothetical protein
VSKKTSTKRSDGDFDGVLDAALEICRQRRETLGLLRAALQANEHDKAISLAKELCGLTDDEAGNRTHPRVN